MFYSWQIIIFFISKIEIYLFWDSEKDCQAIREASISQKRTTCTFKTWNFSTFSLFLRVILSPPPRSGSGASRLKSIRIRIQTHSTGPRKSISLMRDTTSYWYSWSTVCQCEQGNSTSINRIRIRKKKFPIRNTTSSQQSLPVRTWAWAGGEADQLLT